MKIAVVGLGYVGLSLSLILSQRNQVVSLDIDSKKVEMINNKVSPLEEVDMQEFLNRKSLNLSATTISSEAYLDASYIVVATPTNFDSKNNSFDTRILESVIKEINMLNKKACIIVKSTVPLGFTEEIANKYKIKNIYFSPEFLREGKALNDNLNPSRIIIGGKSDVAREFTNILVDAANKNPKLIPVLYTKSHEAEAIKLFSNAYLAMRVSFFNELDTYAEINNLNTAEIIDGLSQDPRIGDYYNNPSFGYGGYCLPKDTKQLLANFDRIPNSIISGIVDANQKRKEFIIQSILEKKPKILGVYSLAMKSNSDNYRFSAIIDIMTSLAQKKIKIQIYEPLLKSTNFMSFKVIPDLDKFKETSDLIIANRFSENLKDIRDKVYSRDIYGKD